MSTVSAKSTQKRRIKSSLQRWKGNLETDERPLFKAFVGEALKRLRGPFLAQHHPNEVLSNLEVAFQFAKQRGSDKIQIDVRASKTKGIITLVNLPDQPFIVDTIRLFLKNNDADYWSGFNLVFPATRDETGRLTGVTDESAPMESLVLLESDNGTLRDSLSASTQKLNDNFSIAQSMVEDFRPMTRCLERFQERLEETANQKPLLTDTVQETANFLKWLLRENFVFMGMQVISDGTIQKSLGIQRIDGAYFNAHTGDWPPPHNPNTVYVRKCDVDSPVHRAGRIDEVLIQLPEPMGGEQVFIRGMFTYRAINQPCRNVPILRRVLTGILEEQEAKPGSFRHKGIANVFDSMPTEFLFTAEQRAISEMVDLVFEAEQQQEVGVTFMMIGGDSAFCLIAMPKTQFSDELRERLQHFITESTGSSYVDHGLFVGRYDTVLLHFFLTGVAVPDSSTLQSYSEQIRSLATPWIARLWHQLAQQYDEEKADRLTDTYGRAFPSSWVRETSAERTVQDIIQLEALSKKGHPTCAVFEDENHRLVMRLYQPEDVYLSDILPVLDDFGLIVLDSYSTEVKSRGGALHMDTFTLTGTRHASAKELLERADLMVAAVEQVFAGNVESDILNQLVISAGLSWIEVDIFRAYTRYMQQIMPNVAPSLTQEIVLGRPALMNELIQLFHARFDPEQTADRKKSIATWEDTVEGHLRRILTHDEHRVFYTLYDLIRHTIRTNVYRTDRIHHYISLKLDVQNIEELEGVRHYREIFVHHKDVEGVHIRFGPVSRGGLRWSDRSDYRTEIMGLATTQQKKNVVIVPEGSKGGFYLKNPSSDPMQRRKEADSHYQTFIRGMLDLTDNSVNGKLTRPERVVCHDDMDPYLVVAADKGTAHLSDTANKISQSYGFWLGDAFASGGSNGYDHKAVGITARGAWVLARRHFAELERDPYNEPFTCVAIGDCGGDVFGNGMTETPHTRLLAAFNHLHIFLDPDPDPATSHTERARLFKAGGRNGGWNHYNPKLISTGGGVFDRTAKTIPLSEQVQQMLGIEEQEMDPHVVIQHILRMKVDLLWNGGIGTYVKHTQETNADADDRSNDSVRVDADELRCAVVGEGGNLGFTQNGRIQASELGVQMNTDAIDNSAGVDMSDHEVNLKILLDRVVERGDLTEKQRNKVLASMTEEVATLVMANNDAHGRQISRDMIRSKQDIFQFGRAIAFLERTFTVDRDALELPDHQELQRRAESGLGLTRPELAVLGAWVKMFVYQQLMAGKPKKVEGYKEMLHTYFPVQIQKTYSKDIDNHMLAKEISMTVATTRIVADAGAAFIPVMIETIGADVQAIVTALLKAQRLARVEQVRSTLEELRTTVSLNTLYKAWVEVIEGARMVALFWLSARGRIPTEKEISSMVPTVDEVYRLESARVRKQLITEVEDLEKDNIPNKVAVYILKAKYLNLALMNWAEARRTGKDLAETIIKNVAVSRASRLLEVIEQLATRSASGQWEPIAMKILYIRYLQLLSRVVSLVDMENNGLSVDELQPILESGLLSDLRRQVDDLLAGDEDNPSPATLLVLEERVASAVSRIGKSK